MLQFVCDYCRGVKESGETWLNGVAAENIGTKAARREVLIDPTWRYERAVLPLAVHFCSLDCKESYLAQLFQQPAALLKVQSTGPDRTGRARVVRAKRTPVTGAVRKRTVTSRKNRTR